MTEPYTLPVDMLIGMFKDMKKKEMCGISLEN